MILKNRNYKKYLCTANEIELKIIDMKLTDKNVNTDNIYEKF